MASGSKLSDNQCKDVKNISVGDSITMDTMCSAQSAEMIDTIILLIDLIDNAKVNFANNTELRDLLKETGRKLAMSMCFSSASGIEKTFTNDIHFANAQ